MAPASVLFDDVYWTLLGSSAYIFDGLFLGLTQAAILQNSMLLGTLGVFLPAALLAAAVGSNHVLWGAMALFMAARAATPGRAARMTLAEMA